MQTVFGHIRSAVRLLGDLLAAAFSAVVEQTRERIAGNRLADRPGRELEAVLAHLLPVDAERMTEAKVMLAFAAAAVHDPAPRRDHRACCPRSARTSPPRCGVASSRRRRHAPEIVAMLLLALVDGLALHTASSVGALPPAQLRQALRVQLALCHP